MMVVFLLGWSDLQNSFWVSGSTEICPSIKDVYWIAVGSVTKRLEKDKKQVIARSSEVWTWFPFWIFRKPTLAKLFLAIAVRFHHKQQQEQPHLQFFPWLVWSSLRARRGLQYSVFSLHDVFRNFTRVRLGELIVSGEFVNKRVLK